jgi:hypothetical protein
LRNERLPRGGTGQRLRAFGRGDGRALVLQFAHPAGGPRAAQQIAIDFGQRAEGARDQPAGQHEGGDGPAGDRPLGHRGGAAPHQDGDRAEDEQADDDRGHDRAEAGCGAWRWRRSASTALAEARALALLLAERLDDLHRAQSTSVTIAPISATRSWLVRDGAQPPPEIGHRQHDGRDADQDQARSALATR